jgi:hypothetical protein
VSNAVGSAATPKDPTAAGAGEEGEEEYDLSLSDLLADVDLGSLEEFVGELLPPHQEQGVGDAVVGGDDVLDGEERQGAGSLATQELTPAHQSAKPSPVSAPSTTGAHQMDEVFDFPDEHIYTGPSMYVMESFYRHDSRKLTHIYCIETPVPSRRRSSRRTGQTIPGTKFWRS